MKILWSALLHRATITKVKKNSAKNYLHYHGTASHLLDFLLFQTVQNKHNHSTLLSYKITCYINTQSTQYMNIQHQSQDGNRIWHKKSDMRKAEIWFSQTKPRTHCINECAALIWCLLTYTIVEFRLRFFSANIKQLRPLQYKVQHSMRTEY